MRMELPVSISKTRACSLPGLERAGRRLWSERLLFETPRASARPLGVAWASSLARFSAYRCSAARDRQEAWGLGDARATPSFQGGSNTPASSASRWRPRPSPRHAWPPGARSRFAGAPRLGAPRWLSSPRLRPWRPVPRSGSREAKWGGRLRRRIRPRSRWRRLVVSQYQGEAWGFERCLTQVCSRGKGAARCWPCAARCRGAAGATSSRGVGSRGGRARPRS